MRFAALLIPALLTAAAVVLLGRVVAAIEFELGRGGIVSCHVGMGGVMVTCEARDAMQFAIAGVIAAAITACAARLLDWSAPVAPTGHRARNELLIAAFGPLILLQFAAVLVVFYFGVFWGGLWAWPAHLLQLFMPYLGACVLGTLGFWAVLRLLRPSLRSDPSPA